MSVEPTDLLAGPAAEPGPRPAAPLAVEAFACAKAGNRPEEYEDAWAAGGLDAAGRARVAVCDGATETSFSGLWASLLARSWVRSGGGAEVLARLGAARRLWRREVRRRPLPWYAAEKANRGAWAAFLGVAVDAASRRWRALAVGDCCLFQVEGLGPASRLVHAFPLSRSAEFGSTPFLLGSVERPEDDPLPRARLADGLLPPSGALLLASDSLSAWLLRRDEENAPAWEAVSALGVADDAEFQALVDAARADGARNDDMTLVRLTWRP